MNKRNEPYIFLHQRIITSYRIPVFEKLLDRIKGMIIVYGKSQLNSSLPGKERPNTDRYVHIKNYYLFKNNDIFFAQIFKYIFKYNPKVIITQYSFSNLIIILLFMLRPILKYKIIGWNHGWDRRKGFHPSISLKDRARIYMIRKADAMIFYSNDSKQVFSNYTDRNKLFVANNTLDTVGFLNLKTKLSKIGRDRIKKELDIHSRYNLIFIARLEKAKNPLKLLSIFKILIKKLKNVSLHIIGSGPLESNLKEIVIRDNIENIKFYGAIYNDEFTGKMLFCSDIMIIPRWVGLSIIHAYCFGCPIVTFDKDYHPPEIEYLKHNKTGYNLWDKTESEIVTRIITYLSDRELQRKFKSNIDKIIENDASVKEMVNGVSNAVKYCLSK